MSQPKPYPLRMSDEMRSSLQESADRSGRSLNAEIVHRLQQSIDASLVGTLNGGPGSPRMVASVEIIDPGIDKYDPRYNPGVITEQLKEVRELLETITQEMKNKKD
ncbi:TPA: Arc family DNA-binding protein [Aeromonas veronii]|uniref:Arc family DNA-binding protein n=1 Tax=Aeromonas caviae TaxID=648 RepID=UPI00227F7662|nr:Arc family DNA-binding protein [Aeromonas caviae]MCY9814487.1 Arc family DNA-binding protein [Aeromonas caviae]